jgi:hypothetical protein
MMDTVRPIIRTVALALNLGVIAVGIWLPVRAGLRGVNYFRRAADLIVAAQGHLPPDGYGEIYCIFLLAPVPAVIAMLWPAQR